MDSVACLRYIPIVEICKAATWRSGHTVTNFIALDLGASSDAQLVSQCSSSYLTNLPCPPSGTILLLAKLTRMGMSKSSRRNESCSLHPKFFEMYSAHSTPCWPSLLPWCPYFIFESQGVVEGTEFVGVPYPLFTYILWIIGATKGKVEVCEHSSGHCY